jgi:hypothetical protein
MTRRPSKIAATCAECGAPLAGDQRYCLECGARHGAPRVDPLETLGFPAEHPRLAVAAAVEGPPAPADRARRAPTPRLTAALAAATLVVGGVVGAALGPGPTPSLAAAPQRVVALVVPQTQAPASAGTSDDATPPPIDEADAATPSAGDDTTTASDDADTTSGDDTTSSDDDTTSGDDDTTTTSSTTPADTTTATAARAPTHIWVIPVSQVDVTAFAPGGAFADLTPQAVFLAGYAAAAPSAAANEIALLGGQVPTADCDADVNACVLPAGETSLPDQLTSINLTWKAYVEDAALRCAPTPSAAVATTLFTTLRQRTDCATTTVGLDALTADLAKVSTTPAFSLVVPTDVDAELRGLVGQITASEAYKKGGVVAIVPDALPPGTDPASPLGALVFSPRSTRGASDTTPTGPVALLRSFDQLLGLDPLAAAAQASAGALDGLVTTSTPSSTSTSTTRRSP